LLDASVLRVNDAPDPYRPPADSDDEAAHGTRSRSSWLDLMLTSVLAILLVPAMLLNAVLWYERSARLGIYDPALGAGPPLQHRPLLVALLVGLVAVGRLGLGRVRSIAPGYRRALVILAAMAALTALLTNPGVIGG
jgi:hypothetical protein